MIITRYKSSCSSFILPGLLFLGLRFHLLHLHRVRLASPHEQVMVTNAEIQDLQNIHNWLVQVPWLPLTDECVLTQLSLFFWQQDISILSPVSTMQVQLLMFSHIVRQKLFSVYYIYHVQCDCYCDICWNVETASTHSKGNPQQQKLHNITSSTLIIQC